MTLCEHCKRLESEKQARYHTFILAMGTWNPTASPIDDGGAQILFHALAREAKFDLDTAVAELRQHQDIHEKSQESGGW